MALIISSDYTFKKNAQLTEPVIIRADSITIDGNGATITGPGTAGDLESFQGNGIFADGCSNVIIRNIRVYGFESGIVVRNGNGWIIEESDFSDNFTNPDFGWGEYKNVGGIILDHISNTLIRHNRASKVWNGLDLNGCSQLLVEQNDFSYCSNVCLKLWQSAYNRFSANNLSYGLRIKPGEVHARDSAGVLVEHASDYNYFIHNDITHGGDGVFIRALDSCVSRGNTFIENDCSHAHNNGFEAWCPENTYIRNTANYCSFGFWLGGSDKPVFIGNEAAFNGRTKGLHNATEADFGHGGIVAVGGSSYHTLVRDNYCHDNAGGGIVLRGDTRTAGKNWHSFHWIIQNNRLERNRWPIYARMADMILVSGNTCVDNQNNSLFEDVTNLVDLEAKLPLAPAPRAVMRAPDRIEVGAEALFDAFSSYDPTSRLLSFQWHIDGVRSTGPDVRHQFMQPGLYRIALTVDNASSAALTWKDVYVVEPQTVPSAVWNWTLTADDTTGSPVAWQQDAPGICSPCCLHIAARGESGGVLTGECPVPEPVAPDAQAVVFWLKFQFSCISEYRKANPVITLLLPDREVSFQPRTPEGDERSLFLYPLFSEARWGWQRIVVPFAGNQIWHTEERQEFTPANISAVRITVTEPLRANFDLWLDNLHFE